MRIIYSLVFTLFCTGLSAQFGISAKYNSNSYSIWEDYFDDEFQPFASDIHSTSYEFGINYWKRLKDKRIEFLPEISFSVYNSFEASALDPVTLPNFDLSMRSFHFSIPTHFYFLDINNDCNCPTFSKQSDFLAKGLYFFLSPGISYNINEVTFASGETTNASESGIAYRIGAGLGYDFGLSDLLTITPFVSYNYGFSNSSKHLDRVTEAICAPAICEYIPADPTNLTQLQFGLRFSFRPDYQSNNF